MLNVRLRALAMAAAVVFALCVSPALAQDPPPVEAARTASRQDIDVAELSLLLKPLTTAELEIEAKAWQQVLRGVQVEISGVRIECLTLQGAELAARQERLVGLTTQRKRAYDRNKAVLSELRSKGGDPSEYEKYADSVTDITAGIDVSDANTAWTTIRTWGRSDEGGLRWAKNVGKFLVVLILSWIVATIVSNVLRRVLDTAVANFSEILERFFVKTTRNLILAIGAMIGLSMLEVEVGPILAAMGVVGFILGFALQETLGNFAAGLMILIYQPYDIGDYVKVAGEQGTVAGMNLVSTVLTSPDNQRIVIPNGKIWGGTITNVTGSSRRRVDMMFGIAYDDDVDHARTVLTEIVTSHAKVLDDPAPVIRLHQLADSSVNFVVRPWVATSDYWEVYWDVTRAVKQRFDEEGISIPFPQRVVHITRKEPGSPELPTD